MAEGRSRPIWAYVVLVAVVLCVGCYYFFVVREGELGQKEAWGVLQAVEADHRGDADRAAPILIQSAGGSDYTVVGLPSTDQTYPRVWIIVNQSGPGPAVKALPAKTHFSVKCSYLTELEQKVRLNPPVLNYLEAQCMK